MSSDFLEIRGIVKQFEINVGPFKKASVHALNHVDLDLNRGRTLSVVGESGCGKTTLGKTILGLLKPDAGSILFNGQEISLIPPRKRRHIQKDLQMIFQDPFSSLNPRKKIGHILSRPLKTFTRMSEADQQDRIAKTCDAVGVDASYLSRYPHQFSGGQRQRVAIARAIILNPALVVADEPISALDVSIQSQILNLMIDLQAELGLTYLFITHDISVVKYISDEVAVMYLGEIVEQTSKKKLFDNPRHPYTRMLFEAVPDISRPFLDENALIQGEIPNPTHLPSGCFFAPRCPWKIDDCTRSHPELLEPVPGHRVRCFRNMDTVLSEKATIEIKNGK